MGILIIDVEAYEIEKAKQKENRTHTTYVIKRHVQDNMIRYYNFLFWHHNYSAEKLAEVFPNDIKLEIKSY